MGLVDKQVLEREGSVHLELIVGGAGSGYAEASNADLIVAIDSGAELDRVADLERILKVPLGEDDTVRTLLERLQGSIPEARELLLEYRGRPGGHLGSGMAQDPRLGRLAILDHERSGELERLFERILVRLLETTNGSLRRVVLREINSNAGGMGSGGAPEVGTKLALYLERLTTAKVLRHMVRIGALSYLPVAPGARRNTARTTLANLELAMDADAPAGRMRVLELLELPLRDTRGRVVRDRRELRDALASTLLQARFTPAVDRSVEGREVNVMLRSAYGGMLRVRPRWSEVIGAEAIAAAAARRLQDAVGKLRREPPAGGSPSVSSIEFQLEAAAGPSRSLDDVMAALRRDGGMDSPILDRLENDPLSALTATVWVKVPQGQPSPLRQVVGGGRPKDLAEVQAVRATHHALLAAIDAEALRAGAERAAAERALEAGRQGLREAVARGRSFRHQLDVLLLSARRSEQRLRRVIAALLDARDRRGSAGVRCEVLAEARALVQARLEAYEEEWLGSLERALDETARAPGEGAEGFVHAPLEEVYGELLEAAFAGSGGRARSGRAVAVRAVLLRSVRSVDLQAVGALLGTTALPEAIVAALEDVGLCWRSPMWGGGDDASEPRYRFVVLPPLAAGDLAALERAVRDRGFAPLLATTDSVAAGVAVVALDFHAVDRRVDVLPPFYVDTAPATPGNGHGGVFELEEPALASEVRS